MLDILCATELLLQTRDTKMNNIEVWTEEKTVFIEHQKRYQTGESRRLYTGDAMSPEEGWEREGRAFQAMGMGKGEAWMHLAHLENADVCY